MVIDKKQPPPLSFDAQTELADLQQGLDRFCNFAGPWELAPAAQLAREATVSWYTYALQSISDESMGPHLTDDVMKLEPKSAMNRYAVMYAEQFALWLRHMESLLQAEQERLATRLERLGPVKTLAASMPPVDRPGDSRPRLAWRMWQMSVRSGNTLGGREIYEMLLTHFDALGGEECRKLSKLLL